MTAGPTGIDSDVSRQDRRRPGLRPTTVAAVVLVAILAASAIVITSGPGEPDDVNGVAMDPASPRAAADATLEPRPSPTPSATSIAPAIPLVVQADPWGLPRLPGSRVNAVDEGIDGAVHWTLTEYVAERATQDRVREHYRGVLRENGWFVGDVDFRAGIWTFTANHGDREAQIEIWAEDDGVHVSTFVSDTVALPGSPLPSVTALPSASASPAGPSDTPRPPRGGQSRAEPPRTDRAGTVRRPPRARPRPPRPRDERRPGLRAGADRDDDDDDDDDGGDDDD